VTARLLVLSALFVAAAAYRSAAMEPEPVLVREPLSRLPFTLGTWSGHDDPRLPQQILDVLGVDEYLSRTYKSGAGPFVSVYVGYYQSQRHGDTIHSPMNCLPGAGWQPVSKARATIAITPGGDPIEVNRYVIQKGIDRQLVLYWYQSRGRVVASEYWSKAYLVYDAFRFNRSDAALVRVITPVAPADGADAAAERRAIDFVKELFPHLRASLPL
jgi:EpsI family protein